MCERTWFSKKCMFVCCRQYLHDEVIVDEVKAIRFGFEWIPDHFLLCVCVAFDEAVEKRI